MKLIYLACPYTHRDATVRNDRVEASNWFAARLVEQGFAVINPISQGHAMSRHLDPELAAKHNFWMNQCIATLRRCDEVFVLPLPGWEESIGVGKELILANKIRIPVSFIQAQGKFDCLKVNPKVYSRHWNVYAI